MNKLYCLLTSLIVLFVFGYLLFDYETLYDIYATKAYFFPFISVMIWVQMIFQAYEHKRFKNFLICHKIALILSILIITSIYITFKPQAKILIDELHYANIAKCMYEDHTVYNVYEEESKYPEIKQRIASDLGGRTLVYPFFVSIFHTFLRCNYYNHYIMNFMVSVLCLFIIYYFIYMIYGKKYGILAIMVCMTFPIFTQYATSSSLEIFNLLFFILLILFGYKLCFHKDAQIAEFLLYTCLLYINIKQNNIYILLFMICFIAWILKDKVKELSFRTAILPIFLIPYFWMNSLLNEISEQNITNTTDLMIYNIKNAFILLSGTNNEYGWMSCPVVLFLILPIIIVCYFIKKHKITYSNTTTSLKEYLYYIIGLYAVVLIVEFLSFKQIMNPNYISRACFILIPVLSFIVIYIYKFFVENTSIDKKMLAIFTALLMLYNLSYGVTGKGIEKEFSFKEIKKVLRFLKEKYPYKDEYLLVSPFPGFFVPYGYDSISIKSFNEFYEPVIAKKKRNKGTNIIIIQELQEGNILPNSILQPEQRTILVYENSIIDGRTVRISIVNLEH